MSSAPSLTAPSPSRRIVRRTITIGAAFLALLVGVVAVDGSEPGRAVPPSQADDDSLYRRLVNEGQIPRPGTDDDVVAPRPVTPGHTKGPTID